jgi:hypothetical protein
MVAISFGDSSLRLQGDSSRIGEAKSWGLGDDFVTKSCCGRNEGLMVAAKISHTSATAFPELSGFSERAAGRRDVPR